MTPSDEENIAPRTAAVLAPSFIEGLDRLSLEELHRRRDEALAEREFQSFLRRLVQAWQDILTAEAARRMSGAAAPTLVERLTAVLAEGPARRTSRGEALRLQLPDADVAEAARRTDEVLGQVSLSIPETIEGRQLEEALDALVEEERAVSSYRAAVIKVHDALQGELMRRFREDPSLVTRDL
jgi:hypothetical protein